MYIASKLAKLMELLTVPVIKCPAARGRGGARPSPSIIGARSSCVLCTPDISELHPLCTVCTTIAPRVLHFSAVHFLEASGFNRLILLKFVTYKLKLQLVLIHVVILNHRCDARP